ncbi:hypothetical protein HPB50_023315 [Hyalomma asiaticum]|uniref:Uncharacterized protein n=1 Tax=Hyalomma asiaticum TaxID=266040 RepID=A0ACB7TTM2_HYAAI|nr:hypothetical protein HPB50_023315 [Hyalomma asiaticum]
MKDLIAAAPRNVTHFIIHCGTNDLTHYTGKMADTPAAACASSTVKSQRSTNWPDAATRALIRLREDNLAALRSNVRNARIYSTIVEELNAGLPYGEGPCTLKQLRLKMDNLAKRYR